MTSNSAASGWKVIALAGAAWLALAALTLWRGAEAPGSLAALTMQTERDAQAALDKAGMAWAKAGVSNGVMTLSGAAPDAQAAERAREAARAGAQKQFGFPGVYHTINTSFAAPVTSAPSSATPSPNGAAGCQAQFQKALAGQEIQFDTGSATLPGSARPLLDALSAAAQRCAAFKIEIGGHTDARGDAGFNRLLSQRRAAAVLEYLVRRGAMRERLTAAGYGASRPLTTETTFAAHRRNRRITFDVTGPQ